MHIEGVWIQPRELPMLTDIEFTLSNGESVMISWESATFGKRRFSATGVSTTNSEGRVSSGNLHFLQENIESLDRIHYLSDSESGTYVKSITFVDQVRGHYKSESWTYENPKYHHHI